MEVVCNAVFTIHEWNSKSMKDWQKSSSWWHLVGYHGYMTLLSTIFSSLWCAYYTSRRQRASFFSPKGYWHITTIESVSIAASSKAEAITFVGRWAGQKIAMTSEAFFPFCDAYVEEDVADWTIKILLHFYAPVSPTKDDFILSIIWKKATISRIQKCSECVSKNVSAILIQPSDIFYVSGGPQLWHLSLFCLQIFASFLTQSFESFLRILQKRNNQIITCYSSFY